MRKIISLVATLCIFCTMVAVPINAASADCTVEGCTTTDITLTNQYMMDGKLQTESNLLYNAMPRRIYTNCSAYSSEKDFIYRLSVEDNYITSYLLYEGDLNFDVNNPIDAIGYYESEEVQKVYWVDGLNTNRFINVANNFNG